MNATLTASAATEHDDGYPRFAAIVRDRIASHAGPVFHTNATAASLWAAFYENLPSHHRGHYACRTCQRFVERYGGLVSIADDGETVPLLWTLDNVPVFFSRSVAALRREIDESGVAGVFLASEKTWGTPTTGCWNHLSGTPARPFTHPLLTASQAMAAKDEDFQILRRALSEYPADLVAKAVAVLKVDALDRSEKTLGVAEWFASVHAAVDAVAAGGGYRGARRTNLVWKAVATAPPGFCHLRSTMISTLLDDLAAKLPFDVVQQRWAEKVHPLRYQRPTTVKEGTLAAAEKVVASLGSAGSLNRRYARLADIPAVAIQWRPSPQPRAATAGVFSHLRESAKTANVDLGTQTVTWERFRRTALADATKIELFVPSTPSPFYGLVTAADPDAPPILRWDTEPRNPVSWYFHHNGSLPSVWRLRGGEYTEVVAVFTRPSHWHHPEKFASGPPAVFFALAGAKPATEQRGGGLFPECLRNEYHGIRSVIEAYSNAAVIHGHEDADANGIALEREMRAPIRLRVVTAGTTATFVIDRLD